MEVLVSDWLAVFYVPFCCMPRSFIPFSCSFQRDAVFGILSKVKPSYRSCSNCMYSSPGASAEAFGESCENLHLASPCRSPTVCTQPSFLSQRTPAFWEQAVCGLPPKEFHGARNDALPSVVMEGCVPEADSDPPAAGWLCDTSEKPRDVSKMPVGAVLGQKNPLGERSPAEVLKENSLPRKDSRQTKDLKYLLFSKELEKPTTNSYLMQHQESLLQLQKAGLVRKHTKELERLSSLPSETAGPTRESPGIPTNAAIPEESQESVANQEPLPRLEPLPSVLAGSSAGKLQKASPMGGLSQKTSTPVLGKIEHMSSFTKDFLKTICYTPSSSRSSNLTRSSSSDSIHSVRGKPGLVQQRTQEIETRLRLAGLTVSSPLKRSNSLAKLGSLNLSSEDLTSDVDLSVLTDLKEAKLSESLVRCDLRPSLRNTEAGPKLLVKSARGKLKSVPWMEKS